MYNSILYTINYNYERVFILDVEVENKGHGPVTTGLEMESCCQKITENELDCEVRYLFDLSSLSWGFRSYNFVLFSSQ
jgi:hypothetical protein